MILLISDKKKCAATARILIFLMIHFIYFIYQSENKVNIIIIDKKSWTRNCNTILKYIRSLNVIIARFTDNETITSNYHPVASIPIFYLE